MKIELERQVMDTMMLSRHFLDRINLRLDEISAISGIRKSTLQSILPRLIKRSWIEKTVLQSYSNEEPKGEIGNLVLVMGKNKKGERRSLLVPKEALEKIDKRYPKLLRTVVNYQFSQEPEYKKQSLRQAVEKMDIRKRRRIMREKSMKFSGRSKLIRNSFRGKSFRKYVFYKLIEYPYHYRIRGRFMQANEEDLVVKPWNTPDGTTRFWKNAATDLSTMESKLDEILVRINLIPRQFR